MKTGKTYILLSLLLLMAVQESHAQTRDSLYNYFAHYKLHGQKLKPSALTTYDVDHAHKIIKIGVGGGFVEQAFTQAIVDSIYDKVYSLLPDSIHKYHVAITTSGRNIEEMVPNAYRRKDFDKSRMWSKEYSDAPWVSNTSTETSYDKGFRGSHIAVWQSHGRFFKAARNTWDWQRPRLYCTTEDLFTQTFVIPYIIPMLENAGAIVYTPRDRNWQNNEVIVDNDNPKEDGQYKEIVTGKLGWHQSDSSGFAHIFDTYSIADNSFKHGTSRQAETTSSTKDLSSIIWTPYIPKKGQYSVYVSYQTLPKSISNAHYQVWHKGNVTNFEVNQQIGGSTWVYLGTFDFDEGMNADSRVILTNQSNQKGMISGDAVRFGSGMGNVLGGGHVSGLPRWAEASRYYTQWAGLTQKVYDHYHSTDDYKDDLYARPRAINELAGGSLFVEDSIGRHVPMELALAFHSDAGYSTNGALTGSLTICTTKRIKNHRIVITPDTVAIDTLVQDSLHLDTTMTTADTIASPIFAAPDSLTTYEGIDRYASHDLASIILTGLSSDLAAYGWPVRPIWDKDYCETREATIPTAILEMLSHENFYDMCLGYDPKFKFDFSRSVYKSVLKYVASTHKREYVIQPLPVEGFSALLTPDGTKAELTWQEVEDPSEPTALPQHFIVYTRVDDGSFDNGISVKGTSCRLNIEPGHIYSYKVVAANKGGVSFPSEILSVYSAPQSKGTILIVNAFTRLEGPAQILTNDQLGFDLDKDPGVQYGLFAGFCGRQKVFSTKHIGTSGDNATGRSSNELEGQIVMGNTFDYPYIHGEAIRSSNNYSFCSISSEAVTKKLLKLKGYSLVDVICGTQKQYNDNFLESLQAYISEGNPLLITGANIDSLHIIEGTPDSTHYRCSYIIDTDSIDTYSFHNELNDQSYSVPSPSVLSSETGTPLLLYPNGGCAALYDRRTVICGIPLETVVLPENRTKLMSLFLSHLLP